MTPPPNAGEKDIEKAKKVIEPAKKKFSEAEWEKLMEAFDEGKGDPAVLAKKLGMWPLLQAEMAFLTGKTASDRIVRRLMISSLVDRVVNSILADTTLQESVCIDREFNAGRGHQLQRKDKDLMNDTGGVSKVRRREPEQKPPRSDSSNRYRTKDKTPEERDPDVDKIASEVHPLDRQEKGMFGMIPETNYHRQVWGRLVEIMASIQRVSEKDFAGREELHKTADQLIRMPKGEEMIQTLIGVARPEMCAEGIYFEMVMKGKTAGFDAMAKSELARTPKTLREAVQRE